MTRYSNPEGFPDACTVKRLVVVRVRRFVAMMKTGELDEMAYEFNLFEQAMVWCYGAAINAAMLRQFRIAAMSGATARIEGVTPKSMRNCARRLKQMVLENAPVDTIAEQFVFLQSLAMALFGKEILDYRLSERIQFARLQHGLCPTCGLTASRANEETSICAACEEAAQSILDDRSHAKL